MGKKSSMIYKTCYVYCKNKKKIPKLSIYEEKNCIKLLVPLKAGGGGVKALAESYAKNARFFLRAP
jgi:hypothetical protein